MPPQEKEKIYPKALLILEKTFEQVQSLLQNKTPPESLGLKQEFVQTLRQIKNLIDVFQKLPKTYTSLKAPTLPSPALLSPAPSPRLSSLLSSPKLTPSLSLDNLLDFVLLSKQEQMPHSSEELFALSVLLKAGFKLEEYILAAEHENPVKIALVLIEAGQKENAEPGSKVFVNLVNELKNNLLEKDVFLQKIETYIQKLKPDLPEMITLNSPQNNTQSSFKTRVLQEGFIESSSLQDEKIPLQALSLEDGFIPPTHWNIQPSLNQIALQGSFLMLRQFPQGMNSLKFEVKNKRNKEKASFNIFAYLTQSFLEEKNIEQETEKSFKDSPFLENYQSQDLRNEPNPLLLGALSFSLDAPIFLTQGFSGKKISAPEHFEFYFLMDWIHPDKRYSRKDFLTLAESTESKNLRACISDLNREGMAGFENYQAALKSFLNSIQKTIPEAKSSLRETENFLTQEVKKYLENKSVGSEKNQLLEAMPRGNLMASILRKTGVICEEGGQFGEALIHFAEASKRPSDKEAGSIVKLENLLQQLRKRFIETQNYASETWIKKAGLATHFIERYQTL